MLWFQWQTPQEQRNITALGPSQGFFLDCDINEPANALVVEFVLELCKALDALVSIAFPVVFALPVCAKALPARLR